MLNLINGITNVIMLHLCNHMIQLFNHFTQRLRSNRSYIADVMYEKILYGKKNWNYLNEVLISVIPVVPPNAKSISCD